MIREDRVALAELAAINQCIGDIVQQVILDQRPLSTTEQRDFGARMVRLGAELYERADHGDTIGSFHLGPNPADVPELVPNSD